MNLNMICQALLLIILPSFFSFFLLLRFFSSMSQGAYSFSWANSGVTGGPAVIFFFHIFWGRGGYTLHFETIFLKH